MRPAFANGTVAPFDSDRGSPSPLPPTTAPDLSKEYFLSLATPHWRLALTGTIALLICASCNLAAPVISGKKTNACHLIKVHGQSSF